MKKLLLASLVMTATVLSAADGKSTATETAVFGGGCFWCVEGTFLIVPGVSKVVSGYAGGHVENPTYKQVCTGDTGHAEVVQVTFDPSKVTYRELVDLFWYMHDPTTLNRQGNDSGTQYRSAIFTRDDAQKKEAEASLAAHQKEFGGHIVTEVKPLKKFYPAEDYHQNFVNDNPNQGYVCAIAKPKIEKFKHKLAELSAKHAK
ncbi:MAG TPA: peptide-methionine (S)-S-oxide reductase MsrA [Verrucomicrobiaceae bacterium]